MYVCGAPTYEGCGLYDRYDVLSDVLVGRIEHKLLYVVELLEGLYYP
jgi:hypothetical protein